MFRLILFSLSITLSLYSSEATYNPIPIGSVIVTTQSSVIAIQTQEYGGNDKLDTIYQAPSGITILNSVLDATSRSFSIIYRNSTANNAIIMRQLISRQQLSSAAYELAVNFTNTLLVTSDVARNRAFGTYDNGRVVLFSLSGLLETTLTFSTEIQNINLVVFNPKNYRLYIITKDELYSCANFDTKQLNCCKASITINNPRWIYFDPANALLQCSVLDGSGRMYQFQLDSMGCPTDITSEQLTTRASLQLAVDQQYVFAATSSENALDNSYLLIRNPTIQPHRFISVGSRIVALQIAYPSRSTGTINPSMCFYGITYNDYRTAVILAAVFGTIMGILMCFNVLFCIDFFMTKSVIRTLKSQIPHDLLEDRWNKLVEEKYAKIALEKARKKDDPPPTRRLSSINNRRTTTGEETAAIVSTTGPEKTNETRLGVPKISDYLRRKSESYLNRRRSDDYRVQYNQNEQTVIQNNPVGRQQVRPAPAHIETVQEENETRSLHENLSRPDFMKDKGDFL